MGLVEAAEATVLGDCVRRWWSELTVSCEFLMVLQRSVLVVEAVEAVEREIA